MATSAGRDLGFPTANLKLEHTAASGLWRLCRAGAPRGEDRTYGGVANFGIRPMFQVPSPLLEVHLFDFDGDLYGQLLQVELISYLRGEQNFPDLEALKAQIGQDAENARQILADTSGAPVSFPPPLAEERLPQLDSW
jgi:riboflavin kinase/FMN adenylyltransferase